MKGMTVMLTFLISNPNEFLNLVQVVAVVVVLLVAPVLLLLLVAFRSTLVPIFSTLWRHFFAGLERRNGA